MTFLISLISSLRKLVTVQVVNEKIGVTSNMGRIFEKG